MIVFLNGQFIAEEQATVSVFDRSFLYGDGLFETLRIVNGKPFCWDQHLRRLTQGAAFLGIHPRFDSGRLFKALTELIHLNKVQEALLRISLSRGVGPRGYSPRGAEHSTLIMSLHPTTPMAAHPQAWRLFTTSFRVSETNVLTMMKTSNKLIQILARRDAEEHGADEALLLNSRSEVCESSSGNVFWVKGNELLTPPVGAGLLPGVTRQVIMDIAASVGLHVKESHAQLNALQNSEGVFLTMSSLGLVEVVAVDGHTLQTSAYIQTLYEAYRNRLMNSGH